MEWRNRGIKEWMTERMGKHGISEKINNEE